MNRANQTQARETLRNHGVPLNRNFFVLSSTEVEGVIAAADACKYRKPPAANGSRARCFYEAAHRGRS